MKKEPQRISLTDHQKKKEPQKLPLTTNIHYDIEMADDIWIKNEDHQQDNKTSVPKLESNETY